MSARYVDIDIQWDVHVSMIEEFIVQETDPVVLDLEK